MATEYTHIDGEVLGRMMQAAKQNKGASNEQFEALQRAVDERKQQLHNRLSQLKNQPKEGRDLLRLNILKEFIILEPDHYRHYFNAGWFCGRLLTDYPAAVAYYTAALQLVDEDPDNLWEIYEERSRSFLYLKDYASALADGKMYLRFKYLAKKYDNSWRRQKSYNLYMICESLRQLGNKALGDEIETTYKLAELSDEGVTDELIEEYLALLGIPVNAPSSAQVSPYKAGLSVGPSRMSSVKQQLSPDPVEVKKRHLRKQMYEEFEIKVKPDLPLVIRLSQELVTLDPTNYRYHATVGEMYSRLRNYAGAMPHFLKALALVDQYPGDAYWQRKTRRQHLFELHRKLAWIYIQKRNQQQAIVHYEQAIRAYPEYRDSIWLLAMIIHCAYQSGYRPRARTMEDYFGKAFPNQDIQGYVLMVELWEDPLEGLIPQFMKLSELGIEPSPLADVRRQTEEELDSVATPQERTEEEQQQTQQVAEMLKHLEALLSLLHTR